MEQRQVPDAAATGETHQGTLYKLSHSPSDNGPVWVYFGGGLMNVSRTSSEDGVHVLHLRSVEQEEVFTLELQVERAMLSDTPGDKYITFTQDGAQLSLSMAEPRLPDALRDLSLPSSADPHPGDATYVSNTTGSQGGTAQDMDISVEVSSDICGPEVSLVNLRACVLHCRELLGTTCSGGSSNSSRGERGGEGDGLSSTGEAPHGHTLLVDWLRGTTSRGVSLGAHPPFEAAVEVLSEAVDLGDDQAGTDAHALAGCILEAVAGSNGELILDLVLGTQAFSAIVAALSSSAERPGRLAACTDVIGARVGAGVASRLSLALRTPVEQLCRIQLLAELAVGMNEAAYRADVYGGPGALSWCDVILNAETFIQAEVVAALGTTTGGGGVATSGEGGTDAFWSSVRELIGACKLAHKNGMALAGSHADEVAGVLNFTRMLLAAAGKTHVRPGLLRRLTDPNMLSAAALALALEYGDHEQAYSAGRERPVADKTRAARARGFDFLRALLQLDSGLALVRRDACAFTRNRAVLKPDVVMCKPVPSILGTNEESGMVTMGEYFAACAQGCGPPGPNLVFALLSWGLVGEEGWEREQAVDLLRTIVNTGADASGTEGMSLTGGPPPSVRTPENKSFMDTFVSESVPWLLLPLSDMVLVESRNANAATAVGILQRELEGPQSAHCTRTRRLEIAERLCAGIRTSNARFSSAHLFSIELLELVQSLTPVSMRSLHQKYKVPCLVSKGLRAYSKVLCLASARWLRVFLSTNDDQLLLSDLVEKEVHSALVAALVLHAGQEGMVPVTASNLLVALSSLQQAEHGPLSKLRLPASIVRRYSDVAAQAAACTLRGKPLLLTYEAAAGKDGGSGKSPAVTSPREMSSHTGGWGLPGRQAFLSSSPQLFSSGFGRGGLVFGVGSKAAADAAKGLRGAAGIGSGWTGVPMMRNRVLSPALPSGFEAARQAAGVGGARGLGDAPGGGGDSPSSPRAESSAPPGQVDVAMAVEPVGGGELVAVLVSGATQGAEGGGGLLGSLPALPSSLGPATTASCSGGGVGGLLLPPSRPSSECDVIMDESSGHMSARTGGSPPAPEQGGRKDEFDFDDS